MRKWILLLTAGFILTLLLTTVGVYWKNFPIRKGKMEVKGIEAPIRIEWDNWGVPHIHADNEEDLFFAQGFAIAQDRLWQMDLLRRFASGRLSEIFGKETIETDLFMRKIGCDRIAEKILEVESPQTRKVLEAYARGVNELIRLNRPGLEFRLLRYRPEPWKPLDSISIGRLVGWDLANWKSDLVMGKIVEKFGLEKAIKLIGIQQSAISEGENKEVGLENNESGIYQLPITNFHYSGGSSNAWVVDGTKSLTGKPLLANDPHLPLSLPSQWIEVHLSGGGYEVMGAAIPGIPGVVIGHNREIAWGLTSAMADDVDFYQLKIHPDNPVLYLWEGKWKEMKVMEVEIRVKGEEEPIRRKIRFTHHGPVLFENVSGLSGFKKSGESAGHEDIAMRWTGFEETDELNAILLLNRANDWESFLKSMSLFKVPSTNVLYADIQGNIGYCMASNLPIRKEGGWHPLPGWQKDSEWMGYYPFADMPSLYNPESHFIVNANQPPPVMAGLPSIYSITHLYELPDRAKRIEERLLEKEKLSLEDFQEIQVDPFSILARRWRVEILRSFSRVKEVERTFSIEKANRIFLNWDLNLDKESSGTTFFEVFMERLLENVFKDDLGENLYQDYSERWLFSTTALDQILMEHDSEWLNGKRRDEIFDETLVEAMEFLIESFGKDPSDWKWGRLHTVSFEHPLGRVFPLNRLLNVGPYPYSGDGRTLLRSQYPHGDFKTRAGDSYRFLCDLSGRGDPSRIGQASRPYANSVLPPGQSGLWGTRHYGDQMRLWLDGGVHTSGMEGYEVEASLELSP